MTRQLNQRLKQQDTLPGSKTTNIPEQLQQPTKNTTRAHEDPMPRSRPANVTRLITHVLSNQVTRDTANTALPIINTSNPDLKRTMNLMPSMANPSDWNEAPTIQRVKDTMSLRVRTQQYSNFPNIRLIRLTRICKDFRTTPRDLGLEVNVKNRES